MPNHCDNNLTIIADSQTLASIMTAITKVPDIEKNSPDYEMLDAYIFENLLPRPADIGDDWYDWSVNNWGTKWADMDTQILAVGDEIVINFSTAWSPPLVGISKISELYPDATFLMNWDEGGLGFMGAFAVSNGNVIALEEIQGEEYPPFVSNDEDYEAYGNLVGELRTNLARLVRHAAKGVSSGI
jgi:hypothetical protein